MSIWDYLIPQTMEKQRIRARNQFQAGLQQPEMFQTDNYPLPQMVQAYEKGYDMPYPTQQAPSPTAPIEGMTTDPNRQTTIEPPMNLPVEYVAPRSLEESSLRQAGIQGRSSMEKNISGLQYAGEQSPRLEGFFQDFGEDIGDYDIPASLGKFQRPEPTEPGESYGEPYWDEKTGSWLQREETTGKTSNIVSAPRGGGDGDSQEADEYKRALDTYKALNQRLDPETVLMINMLGSKALQNPAVQERIKGSLTPFESQQLNLALQFIDYYQRKRQGQYGLGPTQPEQEAATAESFLKRHMGQ